MADRILLHHDHVPRFGAATLVGKHRSARRRQGLQAEQQPRRATSRGVPGQQFFGTTGASSCSVHRRVAFAPSSPSWPADARSVWRIQPRLLRQVIRTHILHGHVSDQEQVLVARITAGLVGLLSIWLALEWERRPRGGLVAGSAFVIALPPTAAILFTLFGSGSTRGRGRLIGRRTVLTIWLVPSDRWTLRLSPIQPSHSRTSHRQHPIGFRCILGTYLGELAKADRLAERKFTRSTSGPTGIGAEPVPWAVDRK